MDYRARKNTFVEAIQASPPPCERRQNWTAPPIRDATSGLFPNSTRHLHDFAAISCSPLPAPHRLVSFGHIRTPEVSPRASSQLSVQFHAPLDIFLIECAFGCRRSAEDQFACVKEVLTTVACLSAENLLFYPPKVRVACVTCLLFCSSLTEFYLPPPLRWNVGDTGDDSLVYNV